MVIEDMKHDEELRKISDLFMRREIDGARREHEKMKQKTRAELLEKQVEMERMEDEIHELKKKLKEERMRVKELQVQ